MTITSVREIWIGRDGSGDLKSGRRYSRVFRVLTNSNFDTSVEATATGTPVIGSLFPSDTTAFCQNVVATQEIFSPRVWIVTCSFSTEQEIADNPLNDPTEFVWNTEQFQRPAFRDRFNRGIVNSAGFPFDPPPDRDDSRISVKMTRNLANVPFFMLTVADKVNSAAFTVDGVPFGAGKAKIQKVSVGKKEFRNFISFRVVSLIMHFREKNWQLKILDAGFMEKDGSERKKILDKNNQEPSSPWPLNGSGAAIADPTISNTFVKFFDVYGTFNFNLLPF